MRTPSGELRYPDVATSQKPITHLELKYYENKVGVSEEIVGQLVKDWELTKANPNYRPLWLFADSGPTAPLTRVMNSLGIPHLNLRF
jgi:hypothetical protein